MSGAIRKAESRGTPQYDYQQARTPEDLEIVRGLLTEYVQELCLRLYEAYGAKVNVRAKLSHCMTGVSRFWPPDGCLVLAASGTDFVGIACLRRIGDQLGEVKHVFTPSPVPPNGKRARTDAAPR